MSGWNQDQDEVFMGMSIKPIAVGADDARHMS
jgi:hypothetical protein